MMRPLSFSRRWKGGSESFSLRWPLRKLAVFASTGSLSAANNSIFSASRIVGGKTPKMLRKSGLRRQEIAFVVLCDD
ncbi:MAG: hypothetical protein CVV42_17480 [Candidatus Riflebacteria bacterium HGW-Riflebacteria-2]|nr:MAG: hypothetical protein CVV42_17480 [Candidatus Riflebacteria bacterium HGW-Riflebacteria-2]